MLKKIIPAKENKVKLLLQSPLVMSTDPEVSEGLYALLEKEVKLVKLPDTEVVKTI